ncbi:MAG: tungstate ABC transporter substrate-binding protein WtpA [Candidatus Margulisiibacteriota bacterium]|nr:MAG: tungstate ABC transporter substrate-binding protein WtpA [Candidatus Margulisiibacteriota bacterium]HCY38195.1 tungstate ABC transporter substrate-binding protein WtpA [Candidatus Margulisiibacteriota bacterium]
MKKEKNSIISLVYLFLLCFAISGVPATPGVQAEQNEKLVIFHAGSLSVPLKDMTEAFKKKYPKVEVIRESAGSRQCARKITELNKQADIMFSADTSVIKTLLMPEYTQWSINFATNEMIIMYRNDSKYADRINGKNWGEILLKDGVTYGHADPNADPCGYRSQLTWQLAEKYYKTPGLYSKLRAKSHIVRPKETDLLALLESGQIDYLFIYKSVAEQHNAKFVVLPDEVNLKNEKYESIYGTVSIDLTGKEPGEIIKQKGGSMVYGVTIPKNAPNYKLALEYVKLVIGPEGQKIMAKNGQIPFNPATSDEKDKLPAELKALVK